MRKLLRANWIRLWQDKVFRLSGLVMLLVGAALPLIHWIDNRNNGAGWTPDATFFTYVFLVPVLLSLLTALYIGSEYSDGTLRNKIIVGHRRSDIYLANLIVGTGAGVLLCLAYMIPHTLLGLALLGRPETEPAALCLYAGLSVGLIVAFAALFTLIAMLCQNRAYATAGCLLLTFALLFAGVHIVSALNEPEYYQAYSYTENGVTVSEEEMRNPNYLSGTKRQIYEFLHDFTPGGQVLQVSGMKTEHAARLALYDAIILLAAACAGLVCFRRKNLR